MQHLLADLLGGDHLPGVDLAVFVRVDAPLAAAAVEPAKLVRFLVVVGVDLAINLDAVEIVGPNVNLLIAVSVEKAAHGLALAVDEQPTVAAGLGAGDQLQFAARLLLRSGDGIDHAGLPRLVVEDFGNPGILGLGQTDVSN